RWPWSFLLGLGGGRLGRLDVGRLVIAELAAAAVRREIERINDVVVRIRHRPRLALERRLGLVGLDGERVDRILLATRAVGTVTEVGPPGAVDLLPEVIELAGREAMGVFLAIAGDVGPPPLDARTGFGAVGLDANIVAGHVVSHGVA